MDRRTFLATPLVFGLDALTGCGGGQADDALAAGLARMRETGRSGLVIVSPADKAEARKLGRDLHRLLEKGSPEARELLYSVVLICLSRDLAKRRIRRDLSACPLFLLAPEGPVVWQGDFNVGSDPPERLNANDAGPKNLLAFLRIMAFGDKDLRLQAWAARIEQELSADEKVALASLEGGKWEDAVAFLRPRAERLGPCIAWRARQTAEPLRTRLHSVLDGPWTAEPETRPGPRLPYGVTVEQGPVEVDDPCPYCGMEAPYRTVVNGKFFKFLPG